MAKGKRIKNDTTKSFLHFWCGKYQATPIYNVQMLTKNPHEGFSCEVTVNGFDFAGFGTSSNRRDAATLAARDFICKLVKAGKLSQSEVPLGQVPISNSPEDEPAASCTKRNRSNKTLTLDHMSDVDEQEEMEEAEDSDFEASFHGCWTLDAARYKLRLMLQNEKKSPDYKFFEVNLDEKRMFLCELSLHVKKLGETIFASEYGPNKNMATKSCALSIVQQLYHLKVIRACPLKLRVRKKRKADIFDLEVDQQLMNDIDQYLQEVGVHPIDIPEDYSDPDPISLTLEKNVEMDNRTKLDYDVLDSEVSWSPPRRNWNPWTGCNINEGPLAAMRLSAISQVLKEEYDCKFRNDSSMQKMLKLRQDLPIYQFKDRILDAIENNSFVIIKGNIGCRKITQVPQYILDHYLSTGSGADCCIVVAQLHRMSAVLDAKKVAEERVESLGQSAGYSVQLESCFPQPYGSILFCTLDDLLNKLEVGLNGVSHIIIDDIHERDPVTDFILIVLRDMVKAFPQLRVILMSAKVETTLFQEYVGDCRIIEVPGRTYPVQEYFLEDCIEMLNFVSPPFKRKTLSDTLLSMEEVHELSTYGSLLYQRHKARMNKLTGADYSKGTVESMGRMKETDLSYDLIKALLGYIKSLSTPGGVIIFFPGPAYMWFFMQFLHQCPTFSKDDYCILPLHSQISLEDLGKVYEPVPSGVTKIFLSTHSDESIITVTDVVYVIDSCKLQMNLFTPKNCKYVRNVCNIWASKTDLEQNKNMAGHWRPGFVFRLCSKARCEKFDDFPPPRLPFANLLKIAITIKLLHLGDIGEYLSKALEPPPENTATKSEEILREMGALDHLSELTPLGKILSRLPVEPNVGRMLVFSCIFKYGDPLCTIATSTNDAPNLAIHFNLSNRELRGNRFSDHLFRLNAFMQWEKERMQGEMAEQSFCKKFLLRIPTLRISLAAKNHLKDTLMSVGFPKACFGQQTFDFVGSDGNLDMVEAILCMSFYPQLFFKNSKGKFITSEKKQVFINNTSVIGSISPPRKFPFPFFVYTEKGVQKASRVCKQLTMVTPLHILLFGCKKVEYVKNLVSIDEWIHFKMSPRDAAKIVALHPVLEDLIMRIASNPEKAAEPEPIDGKLIDLVKRLCSAQSLKSFSRHRNQKRTPDDQKEQSTFGPDDNQVEQSSIRSRDDEDSQVGKFESDDGKHKQSDCGPTNNESLQVGKFGSDNKRKKRSRWGPEVVSASDDGEEKQNSCGLIVDEDLQAGKLGLDDGQDKESSCGPVYKSGLDDGQEKQRSGEPVSDGDLQVGKCGSDNNRQKESRWSPKVESGSDDGQEKRSSGLTVDEEPLRKIACLVDSSGQTATSSRGRYGGGRGLGSCEGFGEQRGGYVNPVVYGQSGSYVNPAQYVQRGGYVNPVGYGQRGGYQNPWGFGQRGGLGNSHAFGGLTTGYNNPVGYNWGQWGGYSGQYNQFGNQGFGSTGNFGSVNSFNIGATNRGGGNQGENKSQGGCQ